MIQVALGRTKRPGVREKEHATGYREIVCPGCWDCRPPAFNEGDRVKVGGRPATFRSWFFAGHQESMVICSVRWDDGVVTLVELSQVKGA